MDVHMTLNSISTHMLPSNSDPNYVKSIKESPDFINTKFQIKKHIQDKYKDASFTPHIHAKLILLECLYMKKCEFVSRDKYIGCSPHATAATIILMPTLVVSSAWTVTTKTT